MTSDEIKAKYSMSDILEMYGIKMNRAGFISCPFHKDKTPSMKIYEDSYNCFSCGESGDIFTFVMKMDNCDFKTAFLSLGGNYSKPDFRSKLAAYRAEKQRAEREKALEKRKRKRGLNNMLINIYRSAISSSKPFSTAWCDNYNALQYQLHIDEELEKEVVS